MPPAAAAAAAAADSAAAAGAPAGEAAAGAPAPAPGAGPAAAAAATAAAAAAAVCQGCGVSEAAAGRRFLSCPKCIELDIHPNCFCSQSCFRSSWSSHKTRHAAAAAAGGLQQTSSSSSSSKGFDPTDVETWKNDPRLREFVGYRFTGALRPWPTSGPRSVSAGVPLPAYASSAAAAAAAERSFRSCQIKVHNEEEIQRLRAACALGREALDLAHALINPGVTADEIDEKVHFFLNTKRAYPSPLNYQGFPKSCCVSVNEVICHGVPDCRPLEEGDIVNVDITVFYKGMHGDLNETFICGQTKPENKKLVQGAYCCLMEAVKECKPGMMYREIGRIVSSVADRYGLSVVRSYCGHGIGELFHTAPSIPHYRNNKAVGVMRPGHVFTIEPMVNLGGWRDQLWPDQWTSVTADGSFSAQFEHTLLCTKDGVEVLTKRTPRSPKLEIDTLGFDCP